MLSCWRIASARHARTPAEAFSGRGAELYGGRWNSKGTAVVYASESVALAALETLVHYDESLGTHRRLVLCRADIPADIPVEDGPASLYIGRWASYPAPRRLAQFGDKWASESRSVVLRVRSAVSPREHNLLLNPRHLLFSRLHLLIVEPFRLDRRLL